jgi:excisionase family DNA binding protein
MAATNLTRMPVPRVDRRSKLAAVPDAKPGNGKIEKLFYRRHEAAYALGLPLRSIDYMIADHRIHTRKYGRNVLIPSSEVKLAAERIMRDEMCSGDSGVRV